MRVYSFAFMWEAKDLRSRKFMAICTVRFPVQVMITQNCPSLVWRGICVLCMRFCLCSDVSGAPISGRRMIDEGSDSGLI
jgi:hypothetical protein